MSELNRFIPPIVAFFLILCVGCRNEPETWIAIKDVGVAKEKNHAVLAVNHLTNFETIGQAVVYDLKTRNELYSIGNFRDWLAAVDISKDGKRVVTGSYDQSVQVWEIGEAKKARQKCRFGKAGTRILDVCLSPNAELVAAGDWEGNLTVWGISTEKQYAVFPKLGDAVDAVVFSPDGNTLAATASGKIVVVDIKSKKIRQTIKAHSPFQTEGLVFSEDGLFLASAGLDHSVRIWDSSNLNLLTKLESTDVVSGLAFAKDAKSLICCGSNRQLFVWKYKEKTDTVIQLNGHKNSVYSVDVSSDGKEIVSCAHDQTARIWNLDSGKLEMTIRPTVDLANAKN